VSLSTNSSASRAITSLEASLPMLCPAAETLGLAEFAALPASSFKADDAASVSLRDPAAGAWLLLVHAPSKHTAHIPATL
ncbi:hypothetical protein OJ928_11425, partial [Streptococcus anginosus]|nr:hypothetical protein [Streptococcus anginosus]